MAAAVRRALVVLTPRFRPLDGPIQLLRAEDGDEVGGIRRYLAAETAAYIGCDHAKLVFGHTRHDRAEKANDVGILRCVPQRYLAGCSGPLRESRAWLHGVRNEPLLEDSLLYDDSGILECG